MKYLKKTFISIGIFALLFFIINEISSYLVGYSKAKIQSYNNDKLIFNNLIYSQEENLKILSNILILDENVKEAYRTNNPEIIKQHITPLWEKVRNDKLTYEIHFFKPPATSFVNFSNFKSIHTDVSDVRTDIVWITTSFQPSFHPFMCKTYAGYRATLPIIDDDGTMLGGVSLGKKIDWIPEIIKQSTKHDSFLVYNKESTNSLIDKYFKEFIQDKEIIGEYILANQTKKIDSNLLKSINFSLTSQDIILDNKKYLLHIYPIIDFNKKTMAYLCTVDDLDSFFKDYYEKLLYNLILIFITAIIIFLLSRKKSIELLQEIDYIAKISENIKKRDFTTLHKIINQKSKKQSDTSLCILEEDILDMGLEIEKKYKTLELENQHKTKLLVSQLYTDKLTKLLNRSALFRDLDIYENAYLAIFNIQSFKRINDVFGFDTGNLILQQVAYHLKKLHIEEEFSIYRVGNDEFVIINHDNITQEDFESHVQLIIKTIEKESFYFNNEESNISINLYSGISFCKDKKLTTSNIALSIAKQRNKDYIIYSEDKNVKTKQLDNIQTIKKIKNALQNDDILVYFQPIVNNEGLIIKYEALVRMRDGDTILTPFHFLEISQRTKYYHDISKHVILKTFDTFKNRDEMFSINLIAQDMMDDDIVALIYKELQRTKDAGKVVFEIVESEDIYNIKEVSDFIYKVKSMGGKIAIDDFGTGFSNFSYILQIRPDYIKIDGSIIKNIDKDPSAKKITQAIATFAKELNIKTVAEFVHSEEVYKLCKELGLDEYQGYYFSEPLML
ncbi:EAL domain-containing protein [bacterium]|nr:EAL domain-containing protein [bacterium]MBU1993977.1 EAL domain-containing protein [bacterium]